MTDAEILELFKSGNDYVKSVHDCVKEQQKTLVAMHWRLDNLESNTIIEELKAELLTHPNVASVEVLTWDNVKDISSITASTIIKKPSNLDDGQGC